MKTTLLILELVLFTILISCGQRKGNRKTFVIKSDTLQTKVVKKEIDFLEDRNRAQDQVIVDSMRLDKILQNAFQYANQNIYKERFFKRYEVSTNGVPVIVEVNLDYHFLKSKTHLIIRRNGNNEVYIDIYLKKGKEFEKLVSHKQWIMEYVNDTIRDINGDGYKDFVVNWYGSNGCCLKAFSNVYLFQNEKNMFSKSYKFINPTFSPKEKIIRGVCYGHPGETEMYKFKWGRENLDTLEYVSYQKNGKGQKTGKVLITTKVPYGGEFKILKVLDSVPKEYRKIEGYDWFTGVF